MKEILRNRRWMVIRKCTRCKMNFMQNKPEDLRIMFKICIDCRNLKG